MKPRMRRLAAGMGMLLFVCLYAVAAASIGALLVSTPIWIQLAYFAAAGLAWVLPLRPVFAWLSKAEKRDPIP